MGDHNTMRRKLSRIGIAAVFAVGVAACDSMELSIEVNQPEEGSLEVVNSNERVLKDAHLVVEAFESEGATRPCAEETISRWQPGATIQVPECAEKVRFTLTSGGETARFSYTKGQLYRRIGRKEVPISR
jgi:hypothetical protein